MLGILKNIVTKSTLRTLYQEREHTAPLFKELGILPLDGLKRGTFMWELENNLLPQSNSGWFSLSNSVIKPEQVLHSQSKDWIYKKT